VGFLSSGLLLRRFGIAIVLGFALHSLSFVRNVPGAWAQSSQAVTEVKRPALQLGSAGRFNEDWSVLRGVDTTDDFWDRLKFIPLSPDQNVWVTLGGQACARGEYFRQFLFGDSEPEQSDGYLLSPFRPSADLHISRYFRMFAEGRPRLRWTASWRGAGQSPTSPGRLHRHPDLLGQADRDAGRIGGETPARPIGRWARRVRTVQCPAG
jgi:hypothetical protein